MQRRALIAETSIMKTSTFTRSMLAVLASFALLAGCKAAYYNTLEKFGKHKRDLLVGRVKDARDDQAEAKEKFKDALTRFSEISGFQGGDLKRAYDTLNDEYVRCDAQANDVHKRIASVEDVAKDLFEEWQNELAHYKSSELRSASKAELAQTKQRYEGMIGAMKRAENKMQPVLDAFHDQVLFMKHNLNAQAIASLQTNVSSIEADVGRLIQEMDAAIKEANAFIASMNTGG